ncbi:hypothetical protein [Pseudomonas sp.]|uniref:hypothetical protein n=1 Tax=Pseudomonas sp. TaxID=306 RepID=UPI0029112FFB|nr:hypothetical protein [Pseudomonas sp.]MDU4254556.1 hypothetical protein [Pseudomonas sp.]
MATNEQNQKAMADALKRIEQVRTAPSERDADLSLAGGQAYADALSEQELITHEQWTSLQSKLTEARRQWQRPERGRGGDFT